MEPNAQAPMTLPQAVQQPNVTGALQNLLLQRVSSANQSQNLAAQRQSALKQYQASLLQQPTISPTEIGAYSWIGNMGRAADPLAAGIAAGGRALVDRDNRRITNEVAAAQAGYEDARELDMIDSRELNVLRMASSSKAANGGIGGAEKILPLYRGLFNSFSQQAKDMQFATPEERAIWIKRNTDEAVRSAVQQFGGSINQAVLNNLFASTVESDESGIVTSAESDTRQIEPTARTQTASNEISPTPPPSMKVTPEEQTKRDSEASRLRNGEVDNGLPAWPTMPGEPSVDRAKFSQSPPPGSPPFRNIPNEKMVAKGAEGMGEGYAKDFTTIQDTAAAARDQLEAYNALEKIDPNTGAFANAQGYIGVALQGMGVDPNTPLIQDAIKNRQANTIISQMSNAALRGEKGVQTRSDEVRIQNELAKTSDPKQAWNYLVQLGKERAQRRVDMFQFASKVASENNGVPIDARNKYLAAIEDDPLTQEFGGKLVFRTQFIDAFKRKYDDATDAEAIEYWKSLEQGWKSRQRGK